MATLTNVRAVVEALGGTAAVAKLATVKRGTVSAWQVRRGVFPAKTYPLIQAELAARGLSAPASLWSIIPPSDAREGAR